jgi:uncharacterized protein (DUF1499 family)
MKGKTMAFFLVALFATIAGVAAYVRLAPSDPLRWNVEPSKAKQWDQSSSWNEVITQKSGAVLRLRPNDKLLARLDAIALATPHTIRLAGSVEQGRITWITRSPFWGFPDYTTAQNTPDGLYIHARLRFGKSDLGVNAKRLREWLAKL